MCQQLGVRQTNDAHRSSVLVSPKYLDEWPDTHCDESSEPAEKLLLILPITLSGECGECWVGDMLAGVAGVAGVAGAFVAAAAAASTCCTSASFES